MWKCALCFAFFVTLRLLLSHINTDHAQSSTTLSITCPVENCFNCLPSYDKYNSLYKHVTRYHANLLDERDESMENRNENNISSTDPEVQNVRSGCYDGDLDHISSDPTHGPPQTTHYEQIQNNQDAELDTENNTSNADVEGCPNMTPEQHFREESIDVVRTCTLFYI